MTRYTFVVQVHPDGLSTLENLSTHERVRITNLAELGPQIELWLEDQASSAPVEPDETEGAALMSRRRGRR